MQTFHPRTLTLPFFAGIAGILFSLLYRSEVSPKATVDLSLSRSEAEEKAALFLRSVGYSVDGLTAESSLQINTPVQHFLAEHFGAKKTSELMRSDSIISHRWNIYFYDAQSSISRMTHQYRVWIAQNGGIAGYNHVIQDTASGEKLSLDSARVISEQFLRHVPVDPSQFRLKRTFSNNLANRTDHTFIYAAKDSLFDARTEVTVRIQGSEVGFFYKEFAPPQDFVQRVNDGFSSFAVLSIISYLILFFLVVVIIAMFLKKYHEGEVGVGTALSVAGFLYGVVAVTSVLGYESTGVGVSMGDTNRTFVKLMLMVIGFFIIYGFLTAMTFAAWSVGESSARRGLGRIISGIDAILHRKIFTSNVAYSVLWGYGTGAGLFGVIAAIYYVLVTSFGLTVSNISMGGVPEAYSPPLYTLLGSLSAAIITEITFRLFMISWIREKTGKVWIGVIVSSLLWSLTATTLWEIPFGYFPPIIHLALFFVIGLALCAVFLRYGILASIIANVIVGSCSLIEPVLFSGGGAFFIEKILFGLLLFAPLAVAAVGFFRGEEFRFTADNTPSHIRRISERERMARELEIARTVQMSLLPKENPRIAGFDIAGICIPALEVGGDYYDFVMLGNTNIGVAIGDVSGKGVPAAIYMTLTKGILQSHAEENISPKVVLSKVNRLMYKTIEKNSFVSMFYAIIDLKTKSIRYSRAGHNPVILAGLRGGTHEFLTPTGVALGLDDGGIFDAVLEEREYQLRSGDLLVFYTDGFTEARNRKGEDFGEERLLTSVERVREKSAEQIVDQVVRDTKDFIGDIPQHDDMTMVVVKVG